MMKWRKKTIGGLGSWLAATRTRFVSPMTHSGTPITTNADGLFRQTIYYPYSWALQCARGDVLDLAVESPTYAVKGKGQIPYIDVAATMDGKSLSLFILNRDLSKPHDVELVWRDAPPQRVQFSQVLTGSDLKASNSFERPNTVAPRPLDVGKPGSQEERSQLLA